MACRSVSSIKSFASSVSPRYRLQSAYTLAAYLLYNSSTANLSLREHNPASVCSSRSLYTYKSIVRFKDSEFHLCFYPINTQFARMRLEHSVFLGGKIWQRSQCPNGQVSLVLQNAFLAAFFCSSQVWTSTPPKKNKTGLGGFPKPACVRRRENNLY